MRRFIVSSANEIISDIKKAREKFNREISVITITSMRFVDFSEVLDEITNLIGLMFDDVEKDDDVNGLYAITDLKQMISLGLLKEHLITLSSLFSVMVEYLGLLESVQHLEF